MEKFGRLTHEQVLEILELYPDTPVREIAEKYGKSIGDIYKTAHRYGVKKSEAFLNSGKSGRFQKGERRSPETEFQKGCVPKTKGKKIEDICKSEEALQRTIATRWKKGNKPVNTKYDGAITIRRQGYGAGACSPYYFIRISENNWKLYHCYLWEKENGKVPKGYNVVFKDGDSLNCVIENLECVSDAELAGRNQLAKYPKDLQKLIKLKNKLIKKIKDYGKK